MCVPAIFAARQESDSASGGGGEDNRLLRSDDGPVSLRGTVTSLLCQLNHAAKGLMFPFLHPPPPALSLSFPLSLFLSAAESRSDEDTCSHEARPSGAT